MSKVVVSVCCTLDSNATQVMKKKEFNHADICPFWCMSVLMFFIVAYLLCSVWFVIFNAPAWTILGNNCCRIWLFSWCSSHLWSHFTRNCSLSNGQSAKTFRSCWILGKEIQQKHFLSAYFLLHSLFIIDIFLPYLPWEKGKGLLPVSYAHGWMR